MKCNRCDKEASSSYSLQILGDSGLVTVLTRYYCAEHYTEKVKDD